MCRTCKYNKNCLKAKDKRGKFFRGVEELEGVEGKTIEL